MDLGDGARSPSAGERRRIAITRALLTDPDLLVLDESTEGLDPPTAHLLNATADRAVLLLARGFHG